MRLATAPMSPHHQTRLFLQPRPTIHKPPSCKPRHLQCTIATLVVLQCPAVKLLWKPCTFQQPLRPPPMPTLTTLYPVPSVNHHVNPASRIVLTPTAPINNGIPRPRLIHLRLPSLQLSAHPRLQILC